MKSLILKSIIFIILIGLLMIGGCSSNKPGMDTGERGQQEGSEIEQLIGVSEQGETTEQNPDEDEVLRLLGISKEKSEEPTTPVTSKNEDQLRREIGDLEKRLSEKDSEISKLKSDLSTKDDQIAQLESNYPKQPSTPAGTYTGTGNLREDYQNALSEYYNRKYKLAIQLFEELLARNLTSSLADNCRYWIGECYYGLGNYNQAIIEFTKVFSYNKSNKMDDSQLKLGICYWKLGDRERARQEFERLLSDYPNSEYTQKAQQFLSRL